MLTSDERKQAIEFQDAVGQLIDEYLLEGMDVDVMEQVLRDESSHLGLRKEKLEHGL